MSNILIKNISLCACMDDGASELKDCDILTEDNRIKKIGVGIKADADTVIDGKNKIALPGFVNTHHHFYQTMTRALPRVTDAKLFDWLIYLYRIWEHLSPEWVEVSTKLAVGELFLSGCTTSLDHYYVFPQRTENLIDVEIDTARKLGLRFHPTRGSMSLSVKDGGLPPDSVVQKDEEILKDTERLLKKYHDYQDFAMTRIVNAPCSPFSVSTGIMKESILFARKHRILSHTHLAETIDEEEFCKEKFGATPVKYMEQVGWLGKDVLFAHCVHLSKDDMKLLGGTGSCVAHCPTSNLRLGSGIAPIRTLMENGATVSIGVDGSASNDSSNMLLEVRNAMLVARVRTGVESMPARDAFYMATRGGAKALGRNDIGELSEGKAADIALYEGRDIAFGGTGDALAALLFCGRDFTASDVICNGKIVVKNKQLQIFDEKEIFDEAGKIFRRDIAPNL
ncbi:MAG: 8-oxoguanine deaminase [Elusimicrobia bacterium CG_4_10_14_3_um_filter_49_12_50_7]|nr:MAG: 8-oxoguanine deaminase [Elusimicrobia bacterium CG03_land_8_20_14_0_80_50_18]PIY17691.1 MAG: 8-oxoguanine deaminase [Elusimicrobia bacterium CG_4_10_14_3_um_filter_49_12_50_7]